MYGIFRVLRDYGKLTAKKGGVGKNRRSMIHGMDVSDSSPGLGRRSGIIANSIYCILRPPPREKDPHRAESLMTSRGCAVQMYNQWRFLYIRGFVDDVMGFTNFG